MEKFTNWRDKGTGIAPFLPIVPSLSQERGVRKLFNNSLTLLKLFVALPVIVILCLFQWTPLAKPLWQMVLKIICGWNVQCTVQGVKRRDQNLGHLPKKGHLYFVNHSSPLDCFILSFIAQGPAVFCIPKMKGKEVIVYKLTLFQAMQFALNGSIFDDEVSFPTVNNATQLKNYVAYVFPEGTTSNGKSVLPLALTQDFLDQFLDTESSTSSSARKPSNLNVHTSQQLQTIHLKVNATLTTPLPIGKWKYLTRMSSQGVTFKCKINEPVLARIEELRTAMCGGDKYNLVGKNLTVESKQKFIKEFGTRRR